MNWSNSMWKMTLLEVHYTVKTILKPHMALHLIQR